jgi:diguanylate cyclase (GGDEF)-like protein
LISKPKKPLFKLYSLVVFSFLLPIVCFFVYAAKYHAAFLYLAAALVVNIILLITFHKRLSKKQSLITLQKEEYFERTNMLKAELIGEWQIIEAFRRKIVNYSQLKELTEKLSMCLSLQETSDVLSAELGKLFGHKDITVILYLFHSKLGELGIYSSQKGQMQVNLKAKKGDLFDQWVVKTLHPLLVEDANNDFRFDVDKISSEDTRDIRSVISAPLMEGKKILGILRVDSPLPAHFTTEDLRFLRTIADLTSIAVENAQLYQSLEELAIKDGLTGLYLRRYLAGRFEEEIARSIRNKHDLSFILLDLDYFKKYNDTFGHIAGDIVLRNVATVLKDHFHHPGNLVCRYGGEEFCVLLPDCSKAKAATLAEDLRKKVEDQQIVLRRQKTGVTISVGVATFPKDARLKEELILKADEALYKAKRGGRNQVCLAS